MSVWLVNVTSAGGSDCDGDEKPEEKPDDELAMDKDLMNIFFFFYQSICTFLIIVFLFIIKHIVDVNNVRNS